MIRKQEAVGLKSITDGEYRRISWNYDFLEQLDNVESYAGERKIKFASDRAAAAADPAARHRQARRLQAASDDRAFQVPEGAHAADAEDDDPVAVVAAFPLRPRCRAGIDLSVDGRFLSRSRRDLPQGGARLRRRRLPLSAARRGQPRLSVRSVAAQGDRRSRRGSGGAAGDLCRHDQCRDRRHPGRHDHHHASVPRQFPLELRRLRRLRAGGRAAVQHRSTCTAISWNTTPSAPAASSRCASCRRARPSCSASSPPRPARWKTRTTSSAASTQAAKFIDLDQLCLSPQCGFASTEEGNALAEDEQWAKLRMIVEIADEVWG